VEHLTQKQIEDYSRRRLPAAELLAVSDHLGECEACRRQIESNDAAFFALHEAAFSEDGHTTHLTAEQTADYVDRHLAGEALQMVDDHLTRCEQCALAVADLREFRNEVAPSLDREYGPATTTLAAPVKSGWREKFVSLFKVAPAPAFGGAALAVLLLAAIGWIIWRTPNENKQEIAVAPTPVSQPTPQVEPSLPPPPSAPPIVAQLNDGSGVLSVDQEGKLSGADNLPPAYQERVKKALTSQTLERSSQLQGLTRTSSALMGSNNQPREFAVVEPVGEVVLSNRPSFRWSAMEGASAYVVEVYDDQFKLVASSPQLTERAWTTTALARGKVYTWQVKATKDGAEVTSPHPPAPQAKFRVLDQAKANEIAKAKRAYGSSHLTLGLLYADAGLLREAEQEFRLLRRANPNSEIARNLLRQVQTLASH
jgi:predicted anti-sigma-YlaC factor YlaD